MVDPAAGQSLAWRALQERYGAGYFHGENSGFSSQGYAQVHATWAHWMPFVRAEVGAGARWLDLGCAYGFLVCEARQAGFRALGLDASRFAAGQAAVHAAAAAGRVACGRVEKLPFANGSFDVVSAFDVLEHVPDPAALIAEAARVLAPGGLFLGATPDPLVFDRDEPTHVAEHVPSWWVRVLEDAGFSVALRFFQAEYNCELVARLAREAPRIAFDGLGRSDPVLVVGGDPALRAALRSGFGADEGEGGRIVGNGAMVYLLNAGAEPLAVDVELAIDEPAELALQLDGRVVARFTAHDPAATSAGVASSPPVRRAELLLPSGGHALRIALPRGWAHLRRLAFAARAATHDALVTTLPFDLYDRYALAAEVRRRVLPGAATLIDVGGKIGGDVGHLAWTGDFFPELDAIALDERVADHPRHIAARVAGRLPFADRAFDVVLALDVLEHVPAAERAAWLAEVWRITGDLLLLGNPFATPGVAEADRFLFELIRERYGYEHRFLAEHLAHGHPDLDATRAFFAGRGASVAVLPSGGLGAWLLGQTMNAVLSHPEQDGSFALANQALNRALPVRASAPPTYRHLLVVDRRGSDLGEALRELAPQAGGDVAAVPAVLDGLARAQVALVRRAMGDA